MIAENQRVQSGWLTEPKTNTRSDSTFTISFLDIFGPNRTRAGDQIVITVNDMSTGKIETETIYTVTTLDIEAFEASVEELPSASDSAKSSRTPQSRENGVNWVRLCEALRMSLKANRSLPSRVNNACPSLAEKKAPLRL